MAKMIVIAVMQLLTPYTAASAETADINKDPKQRPMILNACRDTVENLSAQLTAVAGSAYRPP